MLSIIIPTYYEEKDFIESLLNMKHSGCDVMFQLSLYALAHGWHYNKLIYYLNLIVRN